MARALRENVDIEAGVPVRRPSCFEEMRKQEIELEARSRDRTREQLEPLKEPHSVLLVGSDGPIPLTKRHTHHVMRFLYSMLAHAPVNAEVSVTTRADVGDIEGIPQGPAFAEFVANRHSSPDKHQQWGRQLGVEAVELRGLSGAGYEEFEAVLRSRVAKNIFAAFFIMQLADQEAQVYSGAVLVHVPDGTWCLALGDAASSRPAPPMAKGILSSLASGCRTRFGIKLRPDPTMDGSLDGALEFTARLRAGPPDDAEIERTNAHVLKVIEQSPALYANAGDDNVVAEACAEVFGGETQIVLTAGPARRRRTSR